jgi:hypothetical protein
VLALFAAQRHTELRNLTEASTSCAHRQREGARLREAGVKVVQRKLHRQYVIIFVIECWNANQMTNLSRYYVRGSCSIAGALSSRFTTMAGSARW